VVRAQVVIEQLDYSPRITGSHGLCEAVDGAIYLSDSYAGTDSVYRIDEGFPVPFASGFSIPAGLWIDEMDRIYLCDVGASIIHRYLSNWTYDDSWVVPNPWNMVLDGTDMIVASFDGSVYRVNSSGYTAIWTGLEDPFGIAMDNDGNIYVSEHTAGRISKRTPGGMVSVLIDTLTQPEGIQFGPDGRLWAADTFEGLIYMIDMDGNAEPVDSTGFNFSFAVNLTQTRLDHIYLGCAGSNGRVFKMTWNDSATPTPEITPTSTSTIPPPATPTTGKTGLICLAVIMSILIFLSLPSREKRRGKSDRPMVTV